MKKLYIISMICLLAASVSCSKKNLSEQQTEYGELSVEMELSTDTKAMTEDELRSNAIVNIYKADHTGLVRFYNKYSEMPAPFYLTADKYRVDVIAGESAKNEPVTASWDSKSYKGSKEFAITAGEKTTVAVEAFVNNAVTLISFDQTVQENFNAGYTFTIGIDENTKLTYDASKSGNEGYFIVAGLDEPSFSWTFAGTLTKDGSAFEKSGVIPEILPGKRYKMNLRYTIKDGDIVFTLVVDKTTENIDDTIIFEPVSTGLSRTQGHEVWATHTTFYADVDATENAEKEVRFDYSSDNGVTWSSVVGESYAEGCWKADVTGLTPATEYQYKLVIGGQDVGDPLTFTTEDAPKLPNGSFEYVSLVSGESYYKFYDPDCGVEEGSYMFWGSGNGEGSEGVNGSASMGFVITEVEKSDDVPDGKQCVVGVNNAASFGTINMLTAGNIFTGQFNSLVGTEGGKVNFGRKWTSRPSALKLYFKYSTGLINILNNENLGVTKSDYDRAQIKVAIGTWPYKTYGGTKESPVQVNTTDESTFVDFYTDPYTIANGDVVVYNDGYVINKGEKEIKSTAEWVECTIPLVYRDVVSYPSHIIISCSTSQFGDYFTGCSTAKLWIDAVELIY